LSREVWSASEELAIAIAFWRSTLHPRRSSGTGLDVGWALVPEIRLARPLDPNRRRSQADGPDALATPAWIVDVAVLLMVGRAELACSRSAGLLIRWGAAAISRRTLDHFGTTRRFARQQAAVVASSGNG
jgi:hypothetical protein